MKKGLFHAPNSDPIRSGFLSSPFFNPLFLPIFLPLLPTDYFRVMSGRSSDSDQVWGLIRRLARTLNRKISEMVILLFNHKSAGSFGAVAGFAIAVIFTWKFFRSAPAPRRPKPRRPVPRPPPEHSHADSLPPVSDSDPAVADSTPVQLDLAQSVRRKLNGARKVTFQLLGVILEESNPEELQKQVTVRLSVLEVLHEIAKTCDIYLMERVLDDESEEKVLSALDGAGLFHTGVLTKEKVLFCSTEIGRSSFVRQLEPDWHIDTNLEVVSQLARFIRCQLHISPLALGQIAPNVFTTSSLEQYFAPL